MVLAPRFCLIAALCAVGFLATNANAAECTRRNSSSVESKATLAAENCCARNGKRRQNRCLNRARKRMRKLRTLLSPDVVNQARRAIRRVRVNSCDMSTLDTVQCTEATSTTIDEATNNASVAACDKRFQDRRRRQLKSMRRAVRRGGLFLSDNFSDQMRTQLSSLLNSRSCGAGGESRQNSCGRTVNPRDGFKIGNVYKLGDYTGTPVFITHNGARRGRAITTGGRVIEQLDYTGTANPDNKGPRHHYRLSTSCRSLPNPYLLEIGNTCYTINDPCGRID